MLWISFPGKLKIWDYCPCFPGNIDLGSWEFPGNSPEFCLFIFPVSGEMKKSEKMETLITDQSLSNGWEPMGTTMLLWQVATFHHNR